MQADYEQQLCGKAGMQTEAALPRNFVLKRDDRLPGDAPRSRRIITTSNLFIPAEHETLSLGLSLTLITFSGLKYRNVSSEILPMV
jgi:hypothetical protein